VSRVSSDGAARESTSTDGLLSPLDLCEILKVPIKTIYRWRATGSGPRSIKIGKHVRYRRSDIDAWIEANASPRPA
jgi:excisionase family DNA binding protein